MPFPARHFIAIAVALGCVSLAAQTNAPDAAPGVAIRLEAHEGHADFKIGDPIFVDLVFTGRSGNYSVDAEADPAQAIGDRIYVSPDGGWVRSHQSLTGKSISGNALVPIGADGVRVPVLVNRVILFQKPGNYDVSIATQRLVSPAFRRVEQLEDCDPCPSTNAVRIHIAERIESDETALLTSLVPVLEKTRNLTFGGPRGEENERTESAFQRIEQMPESAEKEKQEKLLMEKESRMIEERLHEYEKQQADRRLAAERLAYLTGDDAVRAKVHFIAEEEDRGDNDLVSFIMIDGLPASRNKQLQLDLLQALWRDPEHVPNAILHTALRDARDLMHDSMVKDHEWGITAEERRADLDRFKSDLALLVPTLPSRTDANRAQTIEFLKKIAIPNQFNQPAANP